MRTRRNSVLIRLNDDEYMRLKKLVSKSGMTQEVYLRSLIRGLVPRDKPSCDYYLMMRELHSIGSDLNQIASRAHVSGVIDEDRYDEQVESLAQVTADIAKAVKEPRKL